MNEVRTIFDPFHGKTVEIRNDLTLRLRGKYANGPTLPNGEPEFGWREFPTPPIQHEAAEAIERRTNENSILRAALETCESWMDRWSHHIGTCLGGAECTCGLTAVQYEARAALNHKPGEKGE